jgi:hypothetical protein
VLHPQFREVLELARQADVAAIHVETDLVHAESVDWLADSAIDVVSVHVPAITPQTYAQLMGVDALTRVIQNMSRFVTRRQQRGRGVPLLAPIFTKCAVNVNEMEVWYDQWLKALGCAVIVGPADYCGQIPDMAVADMSPPRRGPCARIASRLTILSDGRAVSCEQDVLARQQVGDLRFDSLAVVWNRGMHPLRQPYAAGKGAEHPLCAACREWHRP